MQCNAQALIADNLPLVKYREHFGDWIAYSDLWRDTFGGRKNLGKKIKIFNLKMTEEKKNIFLAKQLLSKASENTFRPPQVF